MESRHLTDQGAPSLLQRWQLCSVQIFEMLPANNWCMAVLHQPRWQAEVTRP